MNNLFGKKNYYFKCALCKLYTPKYVGINISNAYYFRITFSSTKWVACMDFVASMNNTAEYKQKIFHWDGN